MRRVQSTDGVEVAVHDFGGRGEPLLLVHATGFCAPVFGPLAALLGASFRCWGLDLRGHGFASTPPAVDFAWSGFADDVLAAVDALGLESPVALGHSSGGAAVLLAEAARPGTFARLWCYEPIVWPDPVAARPRAEAFAARARRRRARFGSRDEAYANFASKPPLSSLAAACLRAYVEHGFEDLGDGSVTLRCRPDVEAAVYLNAVTDDHFRRLGAVACPVVVASGARTEAIRAPVAEAIVDALPAARIEVFDDLGHFGPLQDPAAVAGTILAEVPTGP
jgi:pimeloyl-ACP methyl ester carboxylesterase